MPAVVVGMHLGGLGVTRSLAAAGVPVIAVHDSAEAPEMASRRISRRIVLPIRTQGLIDGLLELARELPERPVLIATVRLPLLLISEYRARLEEAYRFVLPPHAVVQDGENKERLLPMAERAGLQLPRTLVLKDETALASAAGFRYPVILKPADNDPAYMRRFKKAYILEAPEVLTTLVRSIWPYYQDLVLQEWIPGGDDHLYFCLQYRSAAGEVRGSFVGRKLYSWPPGKGATAACTADHQYTGEVRAVTDALLGGIGANGFGSIELKRHRHTGELFLIEPTVGRTDQQEEVAMLNGINLPYIGYCDQLGLPLPDMRPAERPQTWVNPIATRWARQQLRAQGEPRPGLRVGGGAVHDAYFRLTDPAPGVLGRLALMPRIGRPLRRSYAFMRRLAVR